MEEITKEMTKELEIRRGCPSRSTSPVLTFKAYWLRDAPTGLIFNIFMLCPHCIYVFCIYLRTNSDLCPHIT